MNFIFLGLSSLISCFSVLPAVPVISFWRSDMKIKAWLGVKFLNFGFALTPRALHGGRERSPAKRSCLQSPALGQGLELGQCTLLCRAESLLQPLLNQECTEKPRTKQSVKSWLPWFVCCSHLPSVTCSRDNTETEHSLVLIIFLSCSILLSCIYHPEKGGWRRICAKIE